MFHFTKKRIDATLDLIYYPHISVGWDNSPRIGKSPVMKNNIPENFAKALCEAKVYVDAHLKQAPLITINSWSEWVETSYLQHVMFSDTGTWKQ